MAQQFSSDELALLAAIHANPMDDTPRLVYADWLEERKDPPEPEFANHIRAWYDEPDRWHCTATPEQERAWAKPMPRGFELHYERGLPITWLHPNRCTQARLDKAHAKMSPRVGMILMLKESTLLHPIVGTAIFDHPIMKRVHRLRIVPSRSNKPALFIKQLSRLDLPIHRVEMNFFQLHTDVVPLVRSRFSSKYHISIDYLLAATKHS